MRHCRYCDKMKPVDEFAKSTQSTDGIAHFCKACQKVKLELKRAKRLQKELGYNEDDTPPV